MRKTSVRLALIAGLISMVSHVGSAAEMSVQIKSAPMKSTPGVFSSTAATLVYGDRVEILEKKDDWMQVQIGEKTGWVHSSALTKKKILLTASAEDVGAAASSDELALAGKGFSAEVEAEYKTRNPEADFSSIDKVESMTYSPDELKAFLKKGDLLKGDS